MDKIKIFVAEDTEYTELTSIDKGSRNDVIVQIGNKIFHPIFYHIFTLTQEYNESITKGKIYEIDNALILVEKQAKKKLLELCYLCMSQSFLIRLNPLI